jgi:ectoine hydroxylase-related dioxygenase (phytanoyl-CoA dioxygenase family)
VVNPTLRAGDMLIFTEALVHGSRQWTARHTREVLIYSYAPGFMAWRDGPAVPPELATTAPQKALLRPPFVGAYDEQDVGQGRNWHNHWRTPTQPAAAPARPLDAGPRRDTR